MKTKIILLLSFFSVTVFAKDWDKLQRNAEQTFLTQNEIPLASGKFQFYFPINKVEVNQIDNPRNFIASSTEDLRQEIGLAKTDSDYVEIYLYTDAQTINCYAHFEEGKFKSLDHCQRKEGQYGPWEPIK
jgi:hypothetical protein